MSSRQAALAQAVRGPVLLITVGVIFALHQAGILQFWRTWPLLLIVIGVMKLIERLGLQQVQPPPMPPPNMSVPPGGYRP